MKEYDLISYLSCLSLYELLGVGVCVWAMTGEQGQVLLVNQQLQTLRWSNWEKKNGHDPNLSRKSKDKHCNLKSSAIWIGRPLLFQRPHFIQQLTLGNTSFLEIGKAFCSISRGRKKIFIIFDQPIKPEAYNNQKDKNIIKLRLLRLCKGRRR